MSDIKKIEERKICDTRCVAIRWSNNEVQLRQQKMPKISVRDNENNRWKRKAKSKDIKEQKGQAGYSESEIWIILFCVYIRFSPINM